ncbi:MAG: hypothetical protein V1807_01520 [Patescibacteria group bacterium]
MEPKTSDNVDVARLYATTTRPGPGVAMYWPFVIGLVVLLSVVIPVIGWINAHKDSAVANTKLGITQNELALTQAGKERAEKRLENLLACPVSVEVIYDPAETIERPADPDSPDSMRLVWNLGPFLGVAPIVAGVRVRDIIIPLRLMNYACVSSDGTRIIGEEPPKILEVVIHAANQRMELLEAVDGETGFIDQ